MFLLMVDMKSLQALFGGTFDPVHYGHLKPVEILANLIGLSRVIIMPNNVPPHRAQPEASGEQRKRMVELAIADGHKAKTMFKFAVDAEAVHAKIYAKALEAVKKGVDLDVSEFYLCPVCGYIELGKAPEKCPVCGAKQTIFEQVA